MTGGEAGRGALGGMVSATFLFRCPNCRRGKLFVGMYRVAGVCSECGVRFERDEGSWTGPVVIGYAIAALTAAIVGVLLFRTRGLFRGFEAVVAAAACVGALAGYRSAKGWWVWLLWITGQVVTDEQFEMESS